MLGQKKNVCNEREITCGPRNQKSSLNLKDSWDRTKKQRHQHKGVESVTKKKNRFLNQYVLCDIVFYTV